MRVLIVRLGSMGDVIHALPAVAALRAAHPDAHIGWAIERRWTPLLVADGTSLSGPRSPQRPLVDAVHLVNTLAWRKAPFSQETWSEVRNVFRAIRAEKYDIAIDFQGAIKSAVVARFSAAPVRIGFAQPREKQATMFYTSTVQTDAQHVIDQNLALISPVIDCSKHSTIDNRRSEPSLSSVVDVFPSDPAAESSVCDRLPSAGPTNKFAILNPGAGWAAKQWPAPRYGEVARALREDGFLSLINYAPAEESLAREVEANSDGSAQPISCTLSELICLTRRASLFIGGDTGPMHLAVFLSVPTVALFGPTDPVRNGPIVPGLFALMGLGVGNAIAMRHRDSRNNMSHSSKLDPGLIQITAADVIEEVRTLITRQPNADSPEPKA